IYFGRGAYGVQEASQAYFGKDASELTDAEAALLVAVIPSPSSYDPANDLERSTTLWDRVITRQVAVDQMTPAEADALEFPETIEPRSENSLGGDEGYLLMAVRKELLDQGFTEEEINTGGFTIVSANDLERSTTLWDRVITRQVAVDQMTPAEADALEFPETIEPRSENSLGGDEGYLLMAVRKELLDQGFTEEEINTGGFTIVSTI